MRKKAHGVPLESYCFFLETDPVLLPPHSTSFIILPLPSNSLGVVEGTRGGGKQQDTRRVVFEVMNWRSERM